MTAPLTYCYPRVLAAVLLGHLVDEGLVAFGRVVVAREEVEHDLDLNDRVGGGGFNQAKITEIPPRLILEVFNGTERDNFAGWPAFAALLQAGRRRGNVGLFGLCKLIN